MVAEVEERASDRAAGGGGDKPEPELLWSRTQTGLKYVDEELGAGETPNRGSVVSLQYTVSMADSGMELGTSRGRWPLTFAPAKHEVPIFSEAVEGMRVGGRRRVIVPRSRVPPSQINNVPRDQAGESLRFDIELVGVETGLKALVPSLLPPGNRRLAITRALFALSFVPYALPDDIKPDIYRGRDVAVVAQERAERQYEMRNSAWLGSDASLDSLFP